MKFRFILIISMALLQVFASCGDKEPEQNVSQPEVKNEVVRLDTIEESPIVEEVVEEPVSEWPKQVVVQKGDWIYTIARREYGSIYAWKKIYDANRENISDPNMIYPGQVLLLPE